MKRNLLVICASTALLTAGLTSCSDSAGREPDAALWQEDFRYQPVAARPQLEVAYTDSSRTAFEILAEEYNLVGQLRAPHLLQNKADGTPWLWFEMEDASGTRYSTRNYRGETRINLYRRGPYYCEIHWFDVHLATDKKDTAALRGDLTLYCYPEKILADITWHGSGRFVPASMEVKGLVEQKYDGFKPFAKGTIQSYSFPIFGESEPLPADAFRLLAGRNPVRYDRKRGCYILGSHTDGGFQKKLYDEPNFYETVTFRVNNDSVKRKIYVCHESSDGGEITEGGMLLDREGHPMPIVVQVSKNFAGEKEEAFYNPTDQPFSETIFPLYLEPGESHTLTSLHLFQNWGRHMTTHWSSLGAWMDYFHSSTGVTETTCYVPFKFAGLGGVTIADFRAMSQECFWVDQPQHDNLAGHSFLSYYDGKDWIHPVYTGTVYRSTGPNWYDIGLRYLTSDGKIKVTADIFETPQNDELRSYFKVRYEVLQPLEIADARANCRFLTIASIIQGLRFDRFAATGVDEIRLDPSKKPFPVKGVALPEENFFIAEYGDSLNKRGSNAIIVKRFSAGGLKPAATVQLGGYKNVFKQDAAKDTRMCLVPDTDDLKLKAGDVIEIEGYWLPYGATFDTKSPEMVVRYDAEGAMHVVSVEQGEKVSDLPIVVRAENNGALFTVAGGKNLIPVVVKGLTQWRMPRIFVREGDAWRPLYHSRNNALDGYQVFCDEDGTFGAVFLVSASEEPQQLKVTVGESLRMPGKIELSQIEYEGAPVGSAVQIATPAGDVVLTIPQPTMYAVGDERFTPQWSLSEGNSLWFKQQFAEWERGGRLSPNEDDIDLEYWWQNYEPDYSHSSPEYTIDLSGTAFEGARPEALVDGEWAEVEDSLAGSVRAVAVRSSDGKHALALVFLNAEGAFHRGESMGLILKPVDAPTKKRYHVRGKVYVTDADMNTLKKRILSEL